ncbi:unannotated protein [freshwater metagenome]|uniref:Unannotated protein n=1 Tax=freshwater metagenome TaxID=449393 RepID=A0A6J6U2S5_9ZZZZ
MTCSHTPTDDIFIFEKLLPKAAEMHPMTATRIPTRYSFEVLPSGKPTKRTIPKNPSANPKYPILVNFSI